MSTDRDTTYIVRSWLEEGVTVLPDRVLDAVLGQLPATPQRRPMWWAWRSDRMNGYAKLIAVAAALVLAIVGYQVIPAGFGSGWTDPTTSLLARGTFVIRDWGRVEFDATRGLFGVTGHMEIGEGRGPGWPIQVDLQCSRTTEDGLMMIGGNMTEPFDASVDWHAGTLAAVVLKPGSPVKAAIWAGSIANWPATETSDCLAYLDAWLTWSRASLPGDDWLRDDIEGTVEFGP